MVFSPSTFFCARVLCKHMIATRCLVPSMARSTSSAAGEAPADGFFSRLMSMSDAKNIKVLLPYAGVCSPSVQCGEVWWSSIRLQHLNTICAGVIPGPVGALQVA
jgi:hypothetical protein